MSNAFLGNSICLVSIITSEDYIEKTLKSMKKSLDNFSADDAIMICPENKYSGNWYGVRQLNVKIDYSDYSEWIVKKLVNYIDCDYCLTVQWDSCIIDNKKWTNDFLKFSYIGACWQNSFINRVGNGGFCLKSRKFLEESAKLDYIKTDNPIANNEDIVSCVINYEKMVAAGVKFAPISLARQFSVERPIPESPHDYNDISTYKSFGAHGVFNTKLMEFIEE